MGEIPDGILLSEFVSKNEAFVISKSVLFPVCEGETCTGRAVPNLNLKFLLKINPKTDPNVTKKILQPKAQSEPDTLQPELEILKPEVKKNNFIF